METATETTQATTTAEPTTTETVETQAPSFNPEAPEVQQYVKTKYADYDQLKQESSYFRQLQQDQRYQEWVKGLNTPKTPEFQITADEHTAALADPAKFQEMVLKAAEFMHKTKFEPQIQTMEQRAALNESISSLKAFKTDHPEFDELDKSGHIEPVLRAYPRISWEDALAIAKSKSGWFDKQADLKARGQVQTQKKAISEKGGNSTHTKGKKTFANREKAMEYAYKEAQEGREVDPDDIEIS